MYVFEGVDLSTRYITPDTNRWLEENLDNDDAPLYYNKYDSGWVVWTYSACGSDGIPEDLNKIVELAEDHGWRIIVLDCDGSCTDLLHDYYDLWEDCHNEFAPIGEWGA